MAQKTEAGHCELEGANTFSNNANKINRSTPFRTNEGHCASCHKKWSLTTSDNLCQLANVTHCFISSAADHRPSWRMA